MRRSNWTWLAMLGAATLGYLASSAWTPSADAQACERAGYVRGGSCAARERDATGCCPPSEPTSMRPRRRQPDAEPPPNPPPPPPPPPPRANHGWGGVPECEAGLVSNEDTSGRCCWPGQYWLPSPGQCAGTPSCPPGQAAQSNGDCGCAPGRERSANTRGNCCWPGQAWVPSRNACVGRPTHCPSGTQVVGDECARPAPRGMVAIPGGTFSMGSDSGGEDSEPLTVVTLSPYFLDRTEVTVWAYGVCVDGGECTRPDTGEWCNWGRSDRGNHPVNCVDWTQAETYCRWAGKRLPTEAEWEFAARGMEGRTYPWGNQPPTPERLNAAGGDPLPDRSVWPRRMYEGEDGWAATAPVGSYPAGASAEGVMDLSGNVLEWVSDWLRRYPGGSTLNPRGPSNTASTRHLKRVFRGGSWNAHDPSMVRADLRDGIEPTMRAANLGFRCARGES